MKLGRNWMLALTLMSPAVLQAQAQEVSKQWQLEAGKNPDESRLQWQQLTGGEELARGKKVQFSPRPNYRLTTDKNDPYDLTDGTLSSRVDDRIWFNQDAVGWDLGLGTTSGILMVIDLGSVQPVGQIAIRVLGGREQGSLELPAAIEFLASADGRAYFSLQSMVKLNPAEQEQSNFKTGFYIPEEGKAYMVPLLCREAVQARYVALRVRPRTGLFVDQISVLKAAANTPLRSLKSFPEAQVYTDGIVVTPRHNPLVVTTNINTPNWLIVHDNSGLDPTKESLGFRLELPQGLYVLPESQPPFKEIVATKPGVRIYEFSYTGKNNEGSIGPLWIQKDKEARIPAKATIRLTGIQEGKDSHSITSPLQLVTIPEVPPLKGLDISLAALNDEQQRNWPHMLRDFRKLGFGYVNTFPRYYEKEKNGSGKWNNYSQKSLDFLQQGREAGYDVVYNESPFHMMWERLQNEQRAGTLDAAEAPELFTQVDGKPGKHINILYRGKYFQDEIKRVAEHAALVQPDHVYLDIEFWDASAAESRKDPRVIAAWKRSGKDWDNFATDIGTEILGTLVTAMRQAVPQKKLVVGLYNSDPRNKIYNSLFQFDKIYPHIVDIAQPSLYVQGRPEMVAERVRFDYNAMQARHIVPWLSTGTYGEFDPQHTEPLVLESILNGSRGVTYYIFGDFDPMDFYYHSKALAALAPFGRLLQSGKPIAYKGDNPALHYTAFASTNEALILVGNYSRTANVRASLLLPFNSAKKAQMNGKPLVLNGKSMTLNVPPGEFRLISISE